MHVLVVMLVHVLVLRIYRLCSILLMLSAVILLNVLTFLLTV